MHKKNTNPVCYKLYSGNFDDSTTKTMMDLQQYDFVHLFEKYHLDQYFDHLLNYLSDKMIINDKKHAKLGLGLYILVKGKVCYPLTNKQHYGQRKWYLSRLSKQKMPNYLQNLAQSNIHHYGNVISQPFTIIQCEFQSLSLLQDSTLIKIDKDIRRITKFDELYQERLALLNNCHINGELFTNGQLFHVNTKIHSSFKRYTYAFHHTFKLGNVGIIEYGVIRPLKSEAKKLKGGCLQLQKYAVLLPGVQYEVVSTEVKIMTIEGNSTLSYIHPQLISATSYLKLFNQPYFFLRSPTKCVNVDKNVDIYKSIHVMRGGDDKINCMNKCEINKRKKQFIDLSKKYSNELIVTMQTCKQNLQFSNKQTSSLKHSKYNDSNHKNIVLKKINIFDFHKQHNVKSSNIKTPKTEIERDDDFVFFSKLLKQQKNDRKFRITLYEKQQLKYKNGQNKFNDRIIKQRNSHPLSKQCDQPEFYVRALTKSLWAFPKI